MRLARKGGKGVKEERGKGSYNDSFQIASTLDEAKCLNFSTSKALNYKGRL